VSTPVARTDADLVAEQPTTVEWPRAILLAAGASSHEIADLHYRSPQTIRNSLTPLYARLGIGGNGHSHIRLALIRHLVQAGYIEELYVIMLRINAGRLAEASRLADAIVCDMRHDIAH
jgi:DNA-binding CsgD family transcriptional regulator